MVTIVEYITSFGFDAEGNCMATIDFTGMLVVTRIDNDELQFSLQMGEGFNDKSNV